MNIKKDFPIFKNNEKLIFLDSASTSQRPNPVIYAIEDFYKNYNANIHRGLYKLSVEASELYEEARKKIANFIRSEYEEIIFTHGATESLNIIANCLSENLNEGDSILLSEMEHHANLVPWQVIAKKKRLNLRFIPVDNEGNLIIDEKLFDNVNIVSVAHVSNALGTLNDIIRIEKLAHKNNALFVLDAAQSIGHLEVDVKKINCDFLAFSGHKMFGPTGIGVLYGKKELLENLEPFLYGGDMIKDVSLNDSEWNDLPWKFEAGTPNISGAIGLGKAVDYLNKTGIDNIKKHEEELTNYLIERLFELRDIKIYNPKERTGIVSFNVNKIHPHDIAELLGKEGICVRAGHHCCMPLMKKLGINGTVRISLSVYNDEKEIDKLIETLKEIIKRFD